MGQTQPEGLALATVLGTAGTIGSTVIVPAFYLPSHDTHGAHCTPAPDPTVIFLFAAVCAERPAFESLS